MLPIVASLFLAAAPALLAVVQVTPPRYATRKDKVELVVTLTNQTDRAIALLTGHAGAENYFFTLHLQDPSGKVLWDGGAARFIDTDDMPAATFVTVPPHGRHRAVLDWRYLYNLGPGHYKLSVMYRVEPALELHAAGLYADAVRNRQAFVGRVQSPQVEITSTAN